MTSLVAQLSYCMNLYKIGDCEGSEMVEFIPAEELNRQQ